MSTPLSKGFLYALYDVLDFNSQIREGDEDRVWSRIVEKLSVVLDIEAATYFTYMPKTHHLIARYSLGVASKTLSGVPFEVGSGICGWVAERREPLIINDPYEDSRFLKDVDQTTGFKTRNIMAIPLNDRLELTGVIELINKKAGDFSSEDYHFVEAACRATTLTLRNFRIESRVDKVTTHNASIIENLGGGFLAIDMHGRLILCNPAARKILGLAEEMPLNQPIEHALAKTPEVGDILMKTISTRKTAKRVEFTTKVGASARTIGYSTILIQDTEGNVSGSGIIFQDITGKKR